MDDFYNVEKNGFDFFKVQRHSNKKPHDVDMASISLNVALKAYFSTYYSIESISKILNVPKSENNANYKRELENYKEEGDSEYSYAYCENYAKTIIHFHHFVELLCKKILKDSGIDFGNFEGFKSLLEKAEQTQVEERLAEIDRKLQEEKNKGEILKLEKNKSGLLNLVFLKRQKLFLGQLADLRNRLLHRGIYVLRYPVLDVFIGRHIFPLINDVLISDSLFYYGSLRDYKSPHSGINVLNEITEEVLKSSPNFKKVALLKEIGRASYENPLEFQRWDRKNGVSMLKNSTVHKIINEKILNHDARIISRVEKESESFKKGNLHEIKQCPVCGAKSLIVYYDIDDREDGTIGDQFDNSYKKCTIFPYQVKCSCCTFSPKSDIGNASKYGLAGVDDYWVVKES